MPERAVYTDEQRAEALRLYEEVGPAEASRRCGIPNPTIRNWAHRTGISSNGSSPHQANARARAAERWELRRLTAADDAGRTAEKMRKAVEASAKAKDWNGLRAAATAYEKFVAAAQLLSGDVTGRQAWTQTPAEQPKEPPATPADAVAEGRNRALALVMPRATEGE